MSASASPPPSPQPSPRSSPTSRRRREAEAIRLERSPRPLRIQEIQEVQLPEPREPEDVVQEEAPSIQNDYNSRLYRRLQYYFDRQIDVPLEELWKTSEQGGFHPMQLYFNDVKYAVPIKHKKKLFSAAKKKSNNPHVAAPAGLQQAQARDMERADPSVVDNNATEKYILRGVTGVVNPGTLLAIMGASGAGKTTLLNVLAGRCKSGRLEGQILVNGHPWHEAKSLRRYSAYIMQDDILMGTLTPKETLRFAAALKLPKKVTKKEREEKVDKVLDELGLDRCSKTRVGVVGVKRGISGGERKRVSIGNELVSNPSLLFVDEPTSGLDSLTAENVVRTLRELAKSGRTIICTIHQPSSDIFKLFDQLMLLSNGKVAYLGPANISRQYFADLGFPCPRYTNPGDFFIKLINYDPSDNTSVQRIDTLTNAYANSEIAAKQREIPIYVEQLDVEKERKRKTHNRPSSSDFNNRLTYQTRLLTKRSVLDTLREPAKIKTMAFQNIFIAAMLGLIFLRVGNSQADVQNRLGALYFAVLHCAFLNLTNVITLFPQERVLFMREYSNYMYRVTAWYWAKIVADLPLLFFFPVIFAAITYWMIGLQASASLFLIYVAVLVLESNIGAALGMLIGILAKNTDVAYALVPLVVLPFAVFSGFFINTDSVPNYFIWLEYLSPFRWGYAVLVINEFKGLHFTCAESEKLANGKCRFNEGEELIDFLGFNESVTRDVLILLGLFIGLRILCWLALFWRAKSAVNC